jgi:magnesium-transporting ATPase (P-type)
MSGALALGQNLAGIVIALMYAGGNALEDFAVARAERDLRSLIDRAPKIAHRQHARAIEDVPVEQVAVGDDVLVRAGEVIPVDGVVVSPSAILDEAAVTGEPIPVTRQTGELARRACAQEGRKGHDAEKSKVQGPACGQGCRETHGQETAAIEDRGNEGTKKSAKTSGGGAGRGHDHRRDRGAGPRRGCCY